MFTICARYVPSMPDPYPIMDSSPEIITTIIPTYRRPHLLRRAILSVLNQLYPHVRVSVYDNASGDTTEEVVMKLAQADSRIQYHRHPQNIGSYSNFNYGLRNLDTSLFSLLSDDDVLAPDFYSQAMEGFRQHNDAMFASMATMVVDSELRVISKPMPVDSMKFYEPGEAVKGMLEGRIPGTWTGIVYRSEILDGIGLIDATVGPHADGGFVYHAAARYAGVVLPGIAAVLVAHEESVSGTSVPVSGEWVKWWETMMRAIYEDDLVPSEIRKYVRDFPHPDYLRIGVKQIGRALTRRKYEYAARVAHGVCECGYPAMGKLLELLSRFCALPPINALLRVFCALRRKWHGYRHDALHREYGHIVEFIWQYGKDDAHSISGADREVAS